MSGKWRLTEEKHNSFRLVVEIESPLREGITHVWTSPVGIDRDGRHSIPRMSLEKVGETSPWTECRLDVSTFAEHRDGGEPDIERELELIAAKCSEETARLEQGRARNHQAAARRNRTVEKLRELAQEGARDTGERLAAEMERRAAESFHAHMEAFRKEREAWAEAAWNLPHHNGNWHRMTDPEDGSVSYSFLGAGLQAIMDRNPGGIRWSEPESTSWGQPAEPGEDMEFQSVDDTTMTLCDHYALSPDQVDLLDELDAEGLEVEELNRKVREADYTFSLRQGERTIQVQRTAETARQQG